MKTKKTGIISLFVLIIIAGIFAYFLINKKDEAPSTEVRGIFDIDIPADFSEAQIERFNIQVNLLKEKYEQEDLDIEFWLGMGNIYQLMGDYSRSAEAYLESAEIGPLNTVSFTNLARLYEKEIKDYVRAEEYYKKAIENNPRDIWLFIDLGKMYKYRLDNQEKQEEILLKAEKVSEGSIDVLYALSRFYSDSGNMEKAMEYLEKILKIIPDSEMYKEELEKFRGI